MRVGLVLQVVLVLSDLLLLGKRMTDRLAEHPEMMQRRREIVEHPYGNLKQWIMGNGRFLLWGLAGAAIEMALSCLGYNLKRAINILGVAKMMELLC